MLSSSTFKHIAGTAAFIGLMSAAACSGPAPTAQPASGSGTSGGLVARAFSIDLGRVPFDVQAEARFELTNTSTRPVQLNGAPQVKMLEGC
jgi:hypothetical protein